ncbi:MAG: RsmD family RNA methyltransferase [Bacteroidia bacterium]|nr:RsmD family RNA methyltransferase [Bacteroidia bacterium]
MKGRLPKTTRPTTSRAREALFNLLQSRVELNDAACLELYAGTGAVAVECAERGARIVHAVEIHRSLARQIEQKLVRYDGIEIRVFAVDAREFLRRPPRRYDFIFADPPYAAADKQILATDGVRLLTDEGRFVLEHPFYEAYEHVPGFIESRRYGLAVFSFFRRPTQTPTAEKDVLT